ncbi:Alpha/Beta hydrolase protein [Pseudoneurospora amorphoporcata]|uniref:Alpha/Beta hydrolase protein n=1 Tax=Pseudoneurospora amorphoporcata TaxID=241081 RepID=A0AAN6NXP8_9PEZI|nr:Alpha/Beta hydrolase protein [Pseudoneurospora amorphoporcata]
MPHPHYTTFEASDGALLTFKSSLPIENPDPSFIPTSPILTFSGPTGTKTTATAPTGTTDDKDSGKAANRLRRASKASVIAEEGPNYSRLILLLHGFSGSSEYFDRNFDELAKNHWVVAWDMRGHGKSGLRKKKKRKPRAGAGVDDDDAEEDEEEEEGKEEENQDARKRDAGKRDEGTEGQKKKVKLDDSAEGAKKGRTPPGHNNNNRKKKKEKYDTYTGGYHVARLAVDLKNMLDFIKTSRLGPGPGAGNNNNNHSGNPQPQQPPLEIVAIGCSIGAAILWTYIELFTDSDFSGFIFVDQAPLQDRSPFGGWDATKSHKGCYDERTMLAAQAAWNLSSSQRHSTHLALVQECLGYRYHPLATDTITLQQRLSDEEFFTRISAQCPSGEWLARLIADHTRYDHREACEGITCPVLVMGGRRSGCFSLEGMEEVVKRARKGAGNEKAEVSWFESGHWLFWEEADKFNGEVLEFVRRCWSE